MRRFGMHIPEQLLYRVLPDRQRIQLRHQEIAN
jgi:hypothetical protein